MRRTLLATILLLLATAPAAAEELQFGGRFVTRYNDEVLDEEDASGDSGARSDVIYEFGPGVRLTGEHRRFEYEIRHNSSYQLYQSNDQFSDWRHDLRGAGSWQMTPLLSLSASNNFTAQPQLSTIDEEEGVTVEDEVQNSGGNYVLTNSFSTTLTATPSERFVASAQVTNFYRDYENPDFDNQDILSTTVITQGSYQLRPDHRVGVGFSWRTRDFSTTDSSADTGTTNIYQVFGSWLWQIDERTTFSAQMGPAFSKDDIEAPPPINRYAQVVGSPEQLVDPTTCALNGPPVGPFPTKIVDASCEGLDQSVLMQRDLTPEELDLLDSLPLANPDIVVPDATSSSSNVDIFFALALQRQWDRVTAFTDWTRSDSETQGFGGATVQDTFRAGLRYQPAERWYGLLTFRFTRRFSDVDIESAFPVVLDGVVQTLPEIPDVLGAAIISLISNQVRFETTDDLYHVQLRVNRELGRYSTMFAGVDLFRQETETETDFDTFSSERHHYRVEIGLNYRFGPIRF